MYNFSKEDIEIIEKFIDIMNRGYYCNSVQVTSMYNKVLGKNVPNTSCSSCLRGRISELKRQLIIWKENNAKKVENETKVAVENKDVTESKVDVTPEEITEKQPMEEKENATKQTTPKKKPRGKTGGKSRSK